MRSVRAILILLLEELIKNLNILKVKTEFVDIFKKYKELVIQLVYNNIYIAYRQIEEKYKDLLDFKPLTEKEIEKIAKNRIQQRLYNDEKTLNFRINRRINRFIDEIELTNDVEKQTKEIKNKILGRNLSLFSALSVIVFSEFQNNKHELTKTVFRKNAIEILKWNLSPNHPHYNRPEVCEEIAEGHGDLVLEFLNRNNIFSNIEGLYHIDEVPDKPHANCLCEIEPFKFIS